MTFTRRDLFLQAAAAGTLGRDAMAQAREPWFDRPMRWAQVAFVEDDPGHYKPEFWLDYFKRAKCDAACLSAGGCVAFYPTKIPLHYRSKFLGSGDAFGELVAGCRKLGMNVVARTDPHSAHEAMYQVHPDWIAVDANGKKRRHWAAPDQWVTCALGPYNFEFMTEVTREIVSLYKVDGVFSNRWHGSGTCYCEHCRANFKKFSNLDLPRTTDPKDPARRQYIVWHQQRLFELWRLWDAEIKKINPDAAFIANSGGGALSELDMKTIGDLAPILFADRQARRGVMPAWANGKNAKEYRATMGRKPIGGIFSVGVEEPYRWKDSVQSAEEIRLWAVDGIAQGLRPWFTKFNAKPIDTRWLPVVEHLYQWHSANEKYLRNEQSLARVGLVYSQRTANFYGGEAARSKVEDPALGFYHAMVTSRIPFEMVHDLLLDEQHLAPYKTLVLPNIAALSKEQCGQLTNFVERGGGLVATYETSLFNEWGDRLPDFGLANLFGVSADGREGPMQNSYLSIEKSDRGGAYHPLVRGLENASRVINGVHRVTTKALARGALAPLTLVPSYPDLPMEEVYPRQAHTDVPGAIVREVGKGRVVYFPSDIDRTFWEVLSADHGLLLRNAVSWVNAEPMPIDVVGKGVLDLSYWRQRDSLTVHLVNLTNPMMMKGPVTEVFPVGSQQVRITLPSARPVKAVKLLVAGGAAAHRQTGNVLEVLVPQVELHEVVAVDL